VTQSFREHIEKTLREHLKPVHLEVIDESGAHSRRTAKNPETHFKVVIVATAFRELSKVKRQQMVFGLLQPLFDQGLHALAQSTYTPEEWEKSPSVSPSPNCATTKRPS
jgi:BolA family transcriptional regulator, general stress-responsive regulator